MLLCILRNENDPTTKILNNFDIYYDDVKEVFQEMFIDSEKTETPRADIPQYMKEFNEPKNILFPGFENQTGKKNKNSGT
ncbi:MAG: hypothetical protein U5K51_03940 [Flavobacteriaceae bacterium]|nr:hypothetical protein [Flavobacteriaceae bacterium]